MNDKEKKAIEQFSNLDFDIDNFDCKKCVFQEREDCIGCIDYIRKTILNLIENQKAEIEKKDKIIDLMAEEILYENNCSGELDFEIYKDKEEVIKDFEKKAEEDK